MKKKTFFLCLLASGFLLTACFDPQPEPPKSLIDSARQELQDFAKSQNASGSLDFELREDQKKLTTILKNNSVGKRINLKKGNSNVLLGFFSEKEGANGKSNLTKAELIRKDATTSIHFSDANNKIINRFDIPIANTPPIDIVDLPNEFETIDDCVCNYACTFEELKRRANETCQPQGFGIICCLKGQNFCLAIDYYFPPTDWRCQFRWHELEVARELAPN